LKNAAFVLLKQRMSAKPAKPSPLNEQLRNIREQMLGTFQSEPSQTHLTQPLGPFEAHLHARRAELLAPLEHELACVREASWKGADPAAPGADPISHTNDMVRTKLSAALANPEILLYQGVRSVCPEPSAEAIAVCQTQEAKGSSTQADLEAKLEAAQAELEAVKCEKEDAMRGWQLEAQLRQVQCAGVASPELDRGRWLALELLKCTAAQKMSFWATLTHAPNFSSNMNCDKAASQVRRKAKGKENQSHQTQAIADEGISGPQVDKEMSELLQRLDFEVRQQEMEIEAIHNRKNL